MTTTHPVSRDGAGVIAVTRAVEEEVTSLLVVGEGPATGGDAARPR